jgi:predicted transcriptional regulator of viral defense system
MWFDLTVILLYLQNKRTMAMNRLIKYIEERGYVRMKELKEAGFHTRSISALLKEGKIEKVKPGLYKVPNFESPDYFTSFLDVAKAVPKGVICLMSATSYYELSTVNPSEVFIAIPLAEKPQKIEYPPVRVFYWPERNYNLGIEEIRTPSGIIKMYDKEKTVCDLFRYRNKLGEDIALEALKNYLRLKTFDLNKLRIYSEKMRIKTILAPYIKAIVG